MVLYYIFLLFGTFLHEPLVLNSVLAQSIVLPILLIHFVTSLFFIKIPPRQGSIYVFLALFVIGFLTILNCLLNTKYSLANVFQYLMILYSFRYQFLLNNSGFDLKLLHYWKLTLIILCLIICLAFTGYSLEFIEFKSMIYNDYNVYMNPFFGTIHGGFNDQNRISFHFAEPSYLSFFLGLNLVYFIQRKDSRCLAFLLLISAILTFSKTFFIFFPVSLSLFIIRKFGVKSKLIMSVCIFGLLIFVKMGIDFFFSMDDASVLARNARVLMSFKTISEMNLVENLFGLGNTYIVNLRGEGESSAYLKFYVENGFIFTLLIVFLFYRLCKFNLAVTAFVFLSFLSVVTIMSPLYIFNLVVLNVLNKKSV